MSAKIMGQPLVVPYPKWKKLNTSPIAVSGNFGIDPTQYNEFMFVLAYDTTSIWTIVVDSSLIGGSVRYFRVGDYALTNQNARFVVYTSSAGTSVTFMNAYINGATTTNATLDIYAR